MTTLIAAAGRNIPALLLTKVGRAGKAELQNQAPSCIEALEQRLVRQRDFFPAHSARQLQSRHSSFDGLRGTAQPASRLIFFDTTADPETSVSPQEWQQRTPLSRGFGSGTSVVHVFGPPVGQRTHAEMPRPRAAARSRPTARLATARRPLPGFADSSPMVGQPRAATAAADAESAVTSASATTHAGQLVDTKRPKLGAARAILMIFLDFLIYSLSASESPPDPTVDRRSAIVVLADSPD